jgi:hypothetical protein
LKAFSIVLNKWQELILMVAAAEPTLVLSLQKEQELEMPQNLQVAQPLGSIFILPLLRAYVKNDVEESQRLLLNATTLILMNSSILKLTLIE